MASGNDPTKYIQRLVRVISEKQKLIDQLKRQSKTRSRSDDNEDEHSSIVEEALRQELKQMSEEVRALVGKMELMEVRIRELTLGLSQETKLNQQLMEQISDKQQRQKNLFARIADLEQQLGHSKEYEELYHSTQIQLSSFQEQATSLHQTLKSQQSNQLHYFTSIIERHQSEQLLLRQKIGGIYARMKLYPCTKTTQDDPHIQKTPFEVMQEELKHIDQYIRDVEQSDQANVLNETLGDISIIMKSFEEKLENVHCLTKRDNLLDEGRQGKYDKLQQTARSVPVTSKNFLAPDAEKENGVDRLGLE